MKDNINNVSIEEAKKDAEKNLLEFKNIVDGEINDISKFTYADLDKLFQMIFENCQDLTELEMYTEILKKRINISQENKEKLMYQVNMTRKDIINENMLNIFMIYNATALAVFLSTTNPIEFIKRFIIVGIIGITSFDLNARYFSSDYRKKKVNKTLKEIDKYVELSKNDVETINKFREMYIKELNYSVNKLFEVIDKNNGNDIQKNHLRIIKLLKDIDIESFIDDANLKAKVKSKKK